MEKNHSNAYKGLAILSVILCHAAGTFGKGQFTLFTPLGGIGVSVFLVLSAYGLNTAWRNLELPDTSEVQKNPYLTWWIKRFITVWIPYIIVQLIAYWPFHEFEFIPFLLDLTLIKPLYHNGWYLQFLLFWYVCFFFVRRVRILDKNKILIFAIISLIVFFTHREIKAEQSLSYLTGIMLSEKEIIQQRLFKLKYGLLMIIFGVLCLAVKQFSFVRSAPQIIMNLVQLGIKLPIGLGLMIICYITINKYKWIGVALCKVGLVSYELYLIHGYVLNKVPLNAFGVCLFILVTAALSTAYWWIMKKLKRVLLKLSLAET